MRQTGIEAKNGLRCLLMICVLIAVVGGLAAAQTPEQVSEAVVGGLTAAQTAEQVPEPGTSGAVESEALFLGPESRGMNLADTYRFFQAGHVANGVALRNRTSGTIALRGVPRGSVVLMALLYWNFSNQSTVGPQQLPVLFDGNLILGQKTADNPDPCWGMAGNHSYRADVTPFVSVSLLGHPNQDYVVVLLFDGATSTTGQNPWQPFEMQNVRAEGATLVVIYHNPTSLGTLYVYDALSNSEFSGSATFNLLHPLAYVPAQFTMAGADGQLGVTNERTFFNNQQIAGCPVTNSDWDGSDGWPLPQLWDTHTHGVSVNGLVSVVKYQSYGDCLVPVVFILDLN